LVKDDGEVSPAAPGDWYSLVFSSCLQHDSGFMIPPPGSEQIGFAVLRA